MVCKSSVAVSFQLLSEAILKPQIAFEGKAWADEKAQHTREYVSILKRPTTQPSDDRWGLEMASIFIVASYT